MKRLQYIDIARIIAMLSIVGWHHLIQYTGTGYIERYTFDGQNTIIMMMLGLFMFISGYLLGHKSLLSKGEIKAFYVGRIKRFYILYALSALSLFFLGFNSEVSVLITTLTMTSSFILPQPNTLWFLSMLACFYMVTPLIRLRNGLGGGLLLLLAIALHVVLPKGIDERFFIYFPLYCIGMMVANTSFLDRLTKSHLIGIMVVAVAVMIFFLSTRYEWLAYVFVPIGIIGVLFISRLMESERLSKLIGFVAYSSMCAYLFHRQIFIVAYVLVGGGKGIPLWEMLSLVLPICIVISFYTQKIYDIIIKLI